jgi:HD-GYP domain-containing protein (c-di-GMP phosphodiesterase class II)
MRFESFVDSKTICTEQTIHLFHRLTEVMKGLSDNVELELQKRMDKLGTRAGTAIEKLVHRFNTELDQAHQHMSTYLKRWTTLLTKFSRTTEESLEKADNLKENIEVLVQYVLQSQAEVASGHGTALQSFNKMADGELSTFQAIITAAALTVQQQLVRAWCEIFGASSGKC